MNRPTYMLIRLVLIATIGACGSAAQVKSFEVASVKPAAANRERRERIESVPGSLIMGNVRFVSAVRWAFDVYEYQVTGPGWIEEDRFDIMAKSDGPAPERELREMLRTLLAQRFQLATHSTTKEMDAYVVTVGKNGHKLREVQCDGKMDFRPTGPLKGTITCADPDEIAGLISKPLRAPVVNRTGLKGRFEADFDAAPYITPEVTGAKNVMDLVGVGITAIGEQLGLKVESKRVPVQLIVVDRAERTPIEN